MAATRLRSLACLAVLAFSCSSPRDVVGGREDAPWRPLTSTTQVLDEGPRLVAAPAPAAAAAAPMLAGPPGQPGPVGLRRDARLGRFQDGSTFDVEAQSYSADALGIAEILASLDAHFPLILAAETQIDEARARVLGSRGAFDLGINAKVESHLEGFYESDRVDFGVDQQLRTFGARFFGGYRRGVGDFDDWQERDKTNDGGEFRLGVDLPLLQGRAIDKRRVAEAQALIGEERAYPLVQAKRLEVLRKATAAYWKWVASGRRLTIAEQLLALARDRRDQVRSAVAEGELAPIDEVDNQRLIVDRETKLIKALRELEKTGIGLSLYLRDFEGNPLLPSRDRMPSGFPAAIDPEAIIDPLAEEHALGWRPELAILRLELEALDLDVELAENTLLPKLDLKVAASDDNGDPSSLPDEKGPFELKAALSLDVPLQRRAARGKLRALEAKQERSLQKLRFGRDVIVQEVRDATSALRRSWMALEQARQNVELANQLADAERVQFEAGESDLFRVNLREQQAAVAQDGLVSVYDEHFRTLALYRTALGLTSGFEGMTP